MDNLLPITFVWGELTILTYRTRQKLIGLVRLAQKLSISDRD
jgi:hypothetical protein